MKYYNLLGQFSYTKGGTNPDAPEAGPYVYTSPPGFGDNKGVATIQGVVTGPVDKQGHKEKLKDSGLDEDEDFTQFSFGEKEVPDVSDAVRPLSQREYATIKNLDDIKKLNQNRKFSTNQINRLKSAFGAKDIENIFTVGSEEVSTTVTPPNTRFPRNPNLTIKDVEEYSIFGSDAVYVASAIKNIEEKSKTQPESLTMTEAINLLRKYDTIESVTSEEKVNLETTASEGLNNLNNLLSDGTITNTEFNAFSNALTEIVKKPEGSQKKETITGGGSATLYIIVGSPGNYTLKAVNPGDDGYESGMSQEAAQTTANELNDGFEPSGDNDLGEPGGGTTGGGPIGGGPIVGSPGATELNQFNNIPEGAVLVQSDEDRLYLMYTVPGAGTMYKGLPIRMFYEVKGNDLYKAGILTQDAPYEINYFMTEDEIDDFIVAGNTAELPGNDPNTGQAPHPFLSFVDNLTTQAQIAPWLLDKQSISLLAEAALEGREVSEAEWRVTDWYQEHSEAEREWLRLYNADPSTATAQKNDYKIQVSRALQAAGVTGGFDSATGQEKAPPDALVSWIADKWVSGTWSESQTSEQIALFADPFRSGVRDTDFTTYLSTAGVDGLERTAEKEDRIKQLYTQYLGPVFGKLSDAEVSQKAGRLRNDTDYEAALIEQLKNNRLGLFPKYTNPELTYEDIVTPWRNLTTSVWGEAADETQSWWQDMVGTNDFTSGTATLRSKGLEMGNNQVTIEATEALQSALGDGSALQNLGANQ